MLASHLPTMYSVFECGTSYMGNPGLWMITRSKPCSMVPLTLPHPLPSIPSGSLLWCLSSMHSLANLIPKVPLDTAVRKDVYCSAQPRAIDPISELANHLAVNNPPAEAYIFAYIYSGSLHPLTKHAFLSWIHSMASSLGLNSLKGHGIHIRGTLEYLLCAFQCCKINGQWLSNTFMLYLCKHAMIMVPYLQGSPILEAFTRYTTSANLISCLQESAKSIDIS